MFASSSSKCRRCGAELPADAPGGHCPLCLVTVAVEPGPEEGSSAALLPRHFGNYELMEEIARGGMGVVFRARQLALKRQVALKMILGGEFASSQALKRFRQEAEAAASLQHPGIIAIHDVGEWEGQAYFTMDLVEGRTLAELVHEHPLSAHKAAIYIKAIAE